MEREEGIPRWSERLIGLHDEGNDGHFIFPWRSFLSPPPPFPFFLFPFSRPRATPRSGEERGKAESGGVRVRVKDYEGSRERRDQGERGDRRNFSLTQMSDKGIVAARRGGRHRAKRRSDIDLFLSWRERDIYIYREREKEIALAPLVDNLVPCVSPVRSRIEDRCLTFFFF